MKWHSGDREFEPVGGIRQMSLAMATVVVESET